MQAGLESEQRAKAEAEAEAQNAIKRYQGQHREAECAYKEK